MQVFSYRSVISGGCLGLLILGAAVTQAADKPKAKPDPAKVFARKDADGDGSLTVEEFKKGLKEKALERADKRFGKLDTDGDGKLSLAEFEAGMNRQKKAK